MHFKTLLPMLGLVALTNSLATPEPMPSISHAFVIVLENHGYDQVIGNKNLPNLNQFAQKHGLATNYYGVAHPSLPNYVAMIGGDTFGSHSDNPRQRFPGQNLASQLESVGKTWRGYMQGLPKPGYVGNYASGFLPLYAKKHNPFMLYSITANNPTSAANVVPLEQLQTDLANNTAPNFAFIAPDLCHDMHGAPNCLPGARLEQTADAWLAVLVNSIMASPAWVAGSFIVITFDESENHREAAPNSTEVGGHVATIVIGHSNNLGSNHSNTSNVLYNHYSLLRTLEDGFGLEPLRNAAQATPMNDLFQHAP